MARPRAPARILGALVSAFVLATTNARASDQVEWHWHRLFEPCNGNCAITGLVGPGLSTNVQDIFFTAIPPWKWKYDQGWFIGGAASRRIVTLFRVFDIEWELGAGQRFGTQHEGEVWEAFYVRFTGFPWNHLLYTTFALSTGLSYATGISDFEKVAGKLDPPGGTHVLHYFSPELTFALPERRDRELVFRLQHRSGA
ncbi:MAG: hypothetical protein JO237_09445 [Pseudolabrys sp.]|nr:hypothetical protein [Pseudolabrys sp.]